MVRPNTSAIVRRGDVTSDRVFRLIVNTLPIATQRRQRAIGGTSTSARNDDSVAGRLRS
jgi:hypothetical protein